MIRFSFLSAVALVACIAAAYPAISLADDDIPRIATVPEQIESCRSLSGGERDHCLVNLAMLEEDPAVCRAAPESRCAEILGTILMQRCSRYSGEDRSFCEVAVAQESATVAVCAQSSDPEVCVGAVAAARDDPQLIVDNIGDPLTRDMMLATYAADRRDASAVALIEDNRRHDLASTFIVSSVGFGADRIIDASYCANLRGNYVADPDQESEESVRELCDLAVALSNFATTRAAVLETDAEKTAFVSMLEDLAAAVGRGEINAADLISQGGLADPNAVSAPGEGMGTIAAASPAAKPDFKNPAWIEAHRDALAEQGLDANNGPDGGRAPPDRPPDYIFTVVPWPGTYCWSFDNSVWCYGTSNWAGVGVTDGDGWAMASLRGEPTCTLATDWRETGTDGLRRFGGTMTCPDGRTGVWNVIAN